MKYDSTKYIALFYSEEKYERTFDRIRYLVALKSNITDVHSDDDLPFKKHVVMLVKPVFNKVKLLNY